MADEYATVSEGGSRHHYHNEVSSREPSPESRRGSSRVGGGAPKPTERSRVRFNSNSEVNDGMNNRSSFPLRDTTLSSPQTPRQINTSSVHTKPSVPVLRNTADGDLEDVDEDGIFHPTEKAFSALAAQKRGQKMATQVGSPSDPASRRASLELDEDTGENHLFIHNRSQYPVRVDDIPLVNMGNRIYDGPTSESDDEAPEKPRNGLKSSNGSEADKLVRAHTRKNCSKSHRAPSGESSGLVSGQVTPTEERDPHNYVARPQHFRGGVLFSLLKLYNATDHRRRGSSGGSHTSPSDTPTPGTSGANTPSKKPPKWYKQHHSRDTLANLVGASAMLSQPGAEEAEPRPSSVVSGTGKRSRGSRLMDSMMGRGAHPRLEDEIRITVHIAETLSRQKYLIRLCRALMCYGAPTHRLEEYLKMTARVLELNGQFLYIPGCMLISFDDASTHTAEVKLVRSAQGIDLGKLKDVHDVYKEVVHDVIGVEEATQRLDTIICKKQKYHKWLLVIVYGLASATVGPFAFQARWIDLPIAFFLGSLLGILQLVLAPRSDLYSNVFEISAAVLTSFLARAFGSIPSSKDGETLFCFSALAQSAIALILPGYIVLCGSLELQSRSMVAGSVRMVYAIIYSIFLGFGITIGSTIYGLIDSNASSATSCSNQLPEYYGFLFVPLFTLCLSVINQAKWTQMPAMTLIALTGYAVSFFSSKKFPSSAQISNALGALAVGVLGNLYSRVMHAVAAAALLPAIFVLVPSGLAATGSLLAGISSADQITNSTTYQNGTAKPSGNGNDVTVTAVSGNVNSVVLNVGYRMIEVAIGITVGLFLSALIVYPLGKKRSGLFSF